MPFEFFFFRDKEQNEVDVVIENAEGQLIGLEVKAAATVTASDFDGLCKLADTAAPPFTAGFLLYDHDKVERFGDRLFAAPISSLWAQEAWRRSDRARTRSPEFASDDPITNPATRGLLKQRTQRMRPEKQASSSCNFTIPNPKI